MMSRNKRLWYSCLILSLLFCATAYADSNDMLTTTKLNMPPGLSDVIGGYKDAGKGEDNALTRVGTTAAASATTIGCSVGSAYAVGAGNLAGYAGVSSAVSSMGLGGATTAVAGAMGSSATGAAATAVVTSAVGGPVVMGAIIVGGSAAVCYGLYKGGQTLYEWIND